MSVNLEAVLLGVMGGVVISATSYASTYLLKKKRLPANTPHLGTKQVYRKTAAASETILKFIKMKPNAHLRVMTDNFQKWVNSPEWIPYLRERLEEGSSVTVYVGGLASGDYPPEIKSLETKYKDGLNIVDCGTEPFITHFTTVDKPRQVWFEKKHVANHAEDCIYTHLPFDDVWSDLEKMYSTLKSSPQSNKRI